jgi:nucleoside-diphosphate-sugar epimerase
MKRALDGKDVIIPLAALVGAPLCAKDPDAACAVNLGAVELVLQLRDPAQRVIYPNTNSGYGLGQGESFCTEDTPLNPISVYGRTKCQAEQAVLSAGNSITFRLATVFGVSPRMRLDLLVNDFTYRAVNDGFVVLFEAHFMRNYVHVRDVARAFVHAMDNFDAMQGLAYNVGLSEANLSKLELCERIKLQVPGFYFVEAALGEDPDKRNYVVSNARIEATGYQPTVSLDNGIRELIKAYQVVKRIQFSNV